MAKYYVFKSRKNFIKTETKSSALHFGNDSNSVVFRHIDGIPNPWFCYLVRKDGTYRKKGDQKKVYKPDEVREYLKLFFKK